MNKSDADRRPVVGDPAAKDELARRADARSQDDATARTGDADTPGLEAKEKLAESSSEKTTQKILADADVSAPSEDEARIMDHSYDGIQEYDNPMPRWWVWSFWATFWFSLAYIFHYWIGNGVSVEQAYETKLAAEKEKAAARAMNVEVSEESLASLMDDASSLEAGKQVYMSNCQSCHLDKGQGSIGPNLTDNHWIHGGSLMSIYETVAEGVQAKGMPPWEKTLNPQQLRQVVAFVGTLRGTNVEGKPPEGELIENSE